MSTRTDNGECRVQVGEQATAPRLIRTLPRLAPQRATTIRTYGTDLVHATPLVCPTCEEHVRGVEVKVGDDVRVLDGPVGVALWQLLDDVRLRGLR